MRSEPPSGIVLYVDDEAQSLKYFEKAFKTDFQVLTAGGVDEARALLEREGERIAVVVTDQRMPNASGTDLLGWVRRVQPNTVRILTTAFSDLASAIEAVNDGAIFRYITKPWDIRDLRGTLLRALEVNRLQRDRDQLIREKSEVLQRLILVDQVRSHLGRLASPIDLAVQSLKSAQSSLPESNLDLAEAIDGVGRGVARIRSMIADLRSFADPLRETDKEVFEIGEALDRGLRHPSAAEALAVSSAVKRRLEPGVATYAAKTQVATVFSHLIANAAAGLRQVEDGRTHEILVTAKPHGGRLVVSVRDNGIGIPPMNLPRVFDPFFTTKDAVDGMGLGLTICRTIVMGHGGTMQARSEYGRWSELTFDLPLAEKH
jgi:signal transduction histidine kinase